MILVFALIIVIDGEPRPQDTSYWYSINRCNYFAERTGKWRYNYWTKRKVDAYCVPKKVKKGSVEVLR